MSEIYIGYWKRNNDGLVEKEYNGQELIWPIENSVAEVNKENQRVMIERLKKAFSEGYIARYRGWSTCRLCGKHNGTGELEIIRGSTKYCIPEGYLHYLEDHNVYFDSKLQEVM